MSIINYMAGDELVKDETQESNYTLQEQRSILTGLEVFYNGCLYGNCIQSWFGQKILTELQKKNIHRQPL